MDAADPRPPPAPPTEADAPPARPRVRITGVAGALGALCLGVAFFLPWVRVDKERAQQFHDAVEQELERREPPSPAAEGFRELGRTMVRDRALRGTDLILWVRTAQAFSAELDRDVNPGVDAAAHQRRLHLVRLLLYGIPIGAFLLAGHFVFHRFRRARWPVLVLCILIGLAAVVLAATLQYTAVFVGQALAQGAAQSGVAWGWHLLLWGGVVLGLAGFFGVTVGNWFRVYVVSAATVAGLGFLALRFLATGSVP